MSDEAERFARRYLVDEKRIAAYAAYLRRHTDPVRPGMPCDDCEVNTAWWGDGIDEYYMIDHDLWKEVAADARYLCIGCLEERLGRTLCAADFIGAPVNALDNPVHGKSARLRDRLTR